LILLPGLRRYLFAIILIAGLIPEFYKSAKDGLSVKDLAAGTILMAVSFMFWILDMKNVDTLITGHTIWHLANATAGCFLYKHYLLVKNDQGASFALKVQ
jgi:predicted membrane channel-forming protein YqfA (hemolysin III family)